MAKLVLVNLDMNQNQLLQAVMQAGDAPDSPVAGQFYYDSQKKHAYVYNGTAWEMMGNVASVVDADFDASSSNAIQNKAVSTGLVKTLERTFTSQAYTIKGKAFDGTELSSVTISAATISQAGLMSADDKQTLNKVNNSKADSSEAIGDLAISGGTTISWTAVDGSSPDPDSITIPNATTTTPGAMSADDKTKLDGLSDITVDDALSSTSTNPVQNKIINSALSNKADSGTVTTLSNEVKNKADKTDVPADIAVLQSSASCKITLENEDGSTLGSGGAISMATSTNVGVVKLDSSVTQNGANPVTGKAIYDYVGDAIAASDAMIFKGTIGTDGTVTSLPTTYKTGWTYRVITAGTYAGQDCEVGDLIIALVDRNGTGNLDSDWTVAQTNIDGAITDIQGTVPISVDGSGSSRTISHADSSVTPGQYGETSNKTLTFGGTFSMPYVGANKTGHFTSDTGQVTITMPNTTASSSGAGLMSVDAYNKLYSLVSSSVQKKTGTLTAGSKVLSLTVSPEDPAEIINVLVKTPDGEPVIADVTIDPLGSNVSVVIAQAYSANLTVTVWYTVTG